MYGFYNLFYNSIEIGKFNTSNDPSSQRASMRKKEALPLLPPPLSNILLSVDFCTALTEMLVVVVVRAGLVQSNAPRSVQSLQATEQWAQAAGDWRNWELCSNTCLVGKLVWCVLVCVIGDIWWQHVTLREFVCINFACSKWMDRLCRTFILNVWKWLKTFTCESTCISVCLGVSDNQYVGVPWCIY